MGFESGKKFVGVTYKREQNHEEYDAMRRKDREVTKQSEIAQILDMCKRRGALCGAFELRI